MVMATFLNQYDIFRRQNDREAQEDQSLACLKSDKAKQVAVVEMPH